MERKFLFDTVVADYAQARPGYPQQMLDDFFSASGIQSGCRVLEIGCGAGQATELLISNKMKITAVEIGRNMTEHASQRFSFYPDFKVYNSAFEDYKGDRDSFDLVFSASAFHWVDQEVGYKKAYNLLKPNGWLMLCWNSNRDEQKQDTELYEKIQSAYTEIIPEMSENKKNKMHQHETRIENITKDELFTQPLYLTYPYERTLNSEEYTRLMGTYSDHIQLEESKRDQLFERISELIKNNNDQIILNYEVKVYLSKKLERRL